MRALGYIIFVTVILLTFHFVGTFHKNTSPSTLNEEAVKPDLLLSNSRQYYSERSRRRSLHQLSMAIEAIRKIEQDMDDESKTKVDAAVAELDEIRREMSHESFDLEHLNKASIRALNALTYAELKVTEHFVESHETDKAKVALKYGMVHIKNALMYASGSKKDYELKIYEEMDSVLSDGKLTEKEIIEKLELIIEELDNLENAPED
ncbi:MAG: hypothetical protein ACI83W_001361 [Marinoscillum sp.]